MNLRHARSVAAVTAAFLAGTLVASVLAGEALSPIVLQPGQQITIIAATPTPSPSPAPTPSPVATPRPSPTMVATPTPSPTASGPWSVPFLQRTPSGQIHLSNCSNVTISGYQFVGIADDAIIVQGCNNVTITANDFSGDVGGVYVLDSTDVTVTWNRFQNIGDGTIGSGHSNYVQFNHSTGGYVAHNKGIGGNTEDMISLFQSGGTSAAPLVVENNALESPPPPDPAAYSSGSGSCINAGDGGGSYIVVRSNTCLNGGQAGIAVSGGQHVSVDSNVIYGAQRSKSNVGLYVWNQSGVICSAIEASANRVWWINAAGTPNPVWNSGNCGTVAGWSTNVWQDATINPTALDVTL